MADYVNANPPLLKPNAAKTPNISIRPTILPWASRRWFRIVVLAHILAAMPYGT